LFVINLYLFSFIVGYLLPVIFVLLLVIVL